MADVITRFKVETAEYDRKIGQSKTKLKEFEKSGTDAGKALNDFAGKMGMSIPKLGALSLGLGAAAGALKVAKDAFFKNEGTLDEWGRTVESAKTTYEGFLVSLNNGDFSGFLTRINSIVTAARNAYDALDELATFNAFNQVNVEKGKYEFQESIVNFKEGTGTKEDVEKAAQNLKDQLEERRKKEQEAYESKLREFAARDGVDYESLKAVMTGKYGDYDSLKKLGLTGVKSEWKTTMYGMPYEVKSKEAANEEEKMGQMLRQLNDTELQNLQALGAQAQRTAQEMEQINRQVLRYTNETTPKGGGGSNTTTEPIIQGTIADYQNQITALNKTILNATDQEARESALRMVERYTKEIKRMKGETSSIADMAMPDKPTISGIDMSNLQIDPKGLENAQKFWTEYAESVQMANEENKAAVQSIGQVGAALASIDDPMAKVMGIIMESIATVAQSFSGALAKEAKGGVWNWIAAAAAGTATMIATISSIKSATRFANGGIVPGNNFSGDNINGSVMVNSGELILNRAQQGAIASQLQQGANKRQEVEFRIGSNELVGVLRQAENIKSFR